MAPRRLSRLHRRILRCLLAEYRRTNGATSLGHVDLVKALEGDQGNISHSLRRLETRGLITIVVHPVAKRPVWTSPQRVESWPSIYQKVVIKKQ